MAGLFEQPSESQRGGNDSQEKFCEEEKDKDGVEKPQCSSG